MLTQHASICRMRNRFVSGVWSTASATRKHFLGQPSFLRTKLQRGGRLGGSSEGSPSQI